MRDNWITKTFDQLGDILIGGTPARNNALFWSEENTDNAWVSIADLSKAGKKITNTKESITDLGVRASNVKKISKGSIIFSFKLSVGKKAITDRELYTNEAIAAFLFNEKLVDNDYLYYGLDSIDYSKVTDSAIKGVTLNKEKLKRLTINLPPIPQQRKIANILSTCDEVIEKTEAAIAKYQALKQGMMHDLFTRGIDVKTGKLRPSYGDAPELYKESELGMIPKDWEVKKLENFLILKSGDGITSKDINSFGEYSVYGGNGLRGYTNSYTHEGDYVLIGRQGALCGNITLASGRVYASEHAVVVTITDDSDVKWIEYKLRLMNLNQYSEASAQPGLSVGKIVKLSIKVPKGNEQQLIAKRFIGIENRIKTEREVVNKYQQLKAGLMQDLLTGKVEVSFAEEILKN